MTLDQYRKKRDFKKTSEPRAGKSPDRKLLTFVVQKHDASRLHYDFRLEMGGVLKSWAVPKGPSTDPQTKRLAMQVEDHPMDYRLFEGIIPKGEYGGGTVIVWDEGTYEPIEPLKTKKAQEKHLLEQLHKGSLKIRLHGQKLKGEYALVKTSGMGENGWLLIKHKDEYAHKSDVTKKDKSVLSGKTIAAVEKSSDKVWLNGRETDAKKPRTNRKTVKKTTKDADEHLAEDVDESTVPKKLDVAALLKNAPKSSAPENVKPMKATLIDEPFDDPDWVYEVKWDGYRAIARVTKTGVKLVSRNSIPFDKYYPILDLLKTWRINAVIDGEIVVLDDKGLSDFGALQNWRSEADGNLVYYVFDILWYEGKNLMDLPLFERQAILQDILPTDDKRMRLSKVFAARGIEFFDAAEQVGLEGIMAKKADSRYTSDLRSKEWLKIKVQRRQEVVIAGFTRNEGTSKAFSALVLGVYDGKTLRYAGKVGTGFSDKQQQDMMKLFKPLITPESPFDTVPDVDKPSRFRPRRLGAKPTWLKPKLVCEVNYAEVTSEGVFRQASFKGMREDKDADKVVLEKPADADKTVAEAESKAPTDRRTLLNPREETQTRKINGKELKFTHLSKVYWPGEGITKRDLFNYYYRMAEYILPYLKDRPMSLNRFPNGINGPSFYQKDVKGKAPEWVTKTFPYVTSEGEHKEYLVGDDEATLLWMASLACIEMNPWFSRIQSPDNPDYCVIDLDPDKNTFEQVIQAAQEVKKVLDALEVPGYAKTSGSTGIHVYIPLGAKYTYDQSQLFAKIIVNLVHEQLPDFTTLERKVSSRKGKMYLDFLQNRPGATIAGPYSLRPKPGATVSMPLAWDEVKPGLKMKDFTIHNAHDRMKETGDLFSGVLEKGIDLKKTIKKAQSALE
ncbi:DNA ligase D [Parapedobacter sp. GCM10030251]|uniref:DNA ligase D n=1 Tax=Parapedobacter sp. GCM10030251 TaxID=3273419 RepID=UPI0036192C4D